MQLKFGDIMKDRILKPYTQNSVENFYVSDARQTLMPYMVNLVENLMSIQRKLVMIKYWIKLLTLNDQSLLYKTYNMLKIDFQNGEIYNKSNWAYQIKHILDECDLSIIWQNQLNMLIDFQSIRPGMLDIYYQTWYSSINNSRGLEKYCLCKHTFGFEKYFDFIKDAKFRIALT